MSDIPIGAVSSGGVISLLLVMLAAMVYGLWKALSTGALRTNREFVAMEARNALLEKTVETLTDQNRMLLGETIPTITAVLSSFREAAEKSEP